MDSILVCTCCRTEYPEALTRCPKDGAPLCEPEDVARLGQQFSSYQIETVLGVGGMGVVYKARHTALDKPVAIKVLSGRQAKLKRSAREMLREAQAASRTHHPHICDVTDFGTTPDGAAYLVMEYLEGESLNGELLRRGRLPVPRSAAIVRQVAGALGAAHRAGVVHRDLKPENIFLLRVDASARSSDGGDADFVKVLDFGLAKSIDMEPSERTRAGLIAGTPAFMSPEQARGKEIDGRSDIYSLGVVFYRMVAGVLPFTDEGPIATLLAHASTPVVPPAERCSSVDAATSRLIVRCLEKEPAKRFATMEELADELRRIRFEESALEGPPEPHPPPPEAAPAASSSESQPSADRPTVTREIVERVFSLPLAEPISSISSRHAIDRPASGRVSVPASEPAPQVEAPTAGREIVERGGGAEPEPPVAPAARRRPRAAVLLGSWIVLAVLGAGAWLMLRPRSTEGPKPAPASLQLRVHAVHADAAVIARPSRAADSTAATKQRPTEPDAAPPRLAKRPRPVRASKKKVAAPAPVDEDKTAPPPEKTAAKATDQPKPTPQKPPPKKKGKYVDWVIEPEI